VKQLSAVMPGSEDWDAARAAWNLTADQQPAAVVHAEDAESVAAAVAFARENGLRVAAQGTGHGAGARGALDGTILVRTERMSAIAVDPDTRVGRFEAGVIWRDAGEAAGEQGLAVLAGSAPDVGVVGYTTGGGFGWLGRRYGLACNNVRAIELATADGAITRVDAQHDPDLFWAVRGGGGSFGVITALEFDLVELPEVFAGSAIYPADERSGELLHRYMEWVDGVPDEVTSIARFLHLPPLPMVPEPLRDRPLLTLGACYAGPESEGAALIAPLREMGEPVMDTFQTMPPAQLVGIHMEPEEPVPGVAYTATLSEAPEAAVDAFVEAAGPDSSSPLLLAELRHAGGALATAPPGAGARSHLEGEFVFLGVGMAMAPGMAEAVNDHIDSICQALRPWSSDKCYFNFADRPTDVEALFDAETLARLRDVKRRYDADDLFSGGLPISIA
jgi:FAD/FMN-containing dehydrogenase